MMLFGDAGVDAIPELLANTSADIIKKSLAFMTQVALAGGPLNDDGLARLEKIKSLFNQAARQAKDNVTPESFSAVSVSRLPRPARRAAAASNNGINATPAVAKQAKSKQTTKTAAAQSSRVKSTSVKALATKSSARKSAVNKAGVKPASKKTSA